MKRLFLALLTVIFLTSLGFTGAAGADGSFPFIDGVRGNLAPDLVPNQVNLWHEVRPGDPCYKGPPTPVVNRVWYYGQFVGSGSVGKCNYQTASDRNKGAVKSVSVSIPTDAVEPRLEFWLWKKTESAGFFDQLRVEISASSGGLVLSSSSFLDSDWQNYQIGLSAYKGQSVLVKFIFDTGDGLFNDFPGVYLANVKVTARAAKLKVNLITPYDLIPNGSGSIWIELKNQGDLDATATTLSVNWKGPIGLSATPSVLEPSGAKVKQVQDGLILYLGNLPAGQSMPPIMINLGVPETAKDGQVILVSASATTPTFQEDSSGSFANRSIRISTAELAVKIEGPAEAKSCQTTAFKAEIKNTGGLEARDVKATLNLEADGPITFCAARRPEKGNAFAFELGNIPSGESRSVTADLSFSTVKTLNLVVTIDAKTTTVESYPDNRVVKKLTVSPILYNLYVPLIVR